MPTEPRTKRAYAFIDGQNLYYAAREAFGHKYPNYDIVKLAARVCKAQGWRLCETFFYTGIPSARDNPAWNRFWTAKLAVMGTRGVHTFTREVRYRKQDVALPDGTATKVLVGQEKGVDIRLALDVVRHALEGSFDVAIVFSQDQDLSEMADEVRMISSQQSRWMKVCSAFPSGPKGRNPRGINNTEWFKIDRKTYNACLDPNDYRRKKKTKKKKSATGVKKKKK
jgi:uncharacterized LabA/DUF88 family protein